MLKDSLGQNSITVSTNLFFSDQRKLELSGITRTCRGKSKNRLLAPLTDSILVEAAHQPQFPYPKVSRKTG